MKHIQITLLFTVVVLGMPLLPLLAQAVDGQTPPKPMPMGGMTVMSAMMETCQKSCATMAGTMADLTKIVETAKASNDVAKLQAALDQVQTGVAKMAAQEKDCQAMMEHMHQMMPMSGGASH